MVTYLRGNDNLDSSNVATDTELAAAGPSTTFGAVGTYVWAGKPTTGITSYSASSTYSGSDLHPGGFSSNSPGASGNRMYYGTSSTDTVIPGHYGALSGTWRAMGETYNATFQNYGAVTLFVRIS